MDYSNNQVHIQAGDVCISINCLDIYALDWLKATYVEFLCNKPADIFVELSTLDSMSLEEMEQQVKNTHLVHKDGYFDLDKLVTGNYNYDSKIVRVRIEKKLLAQRYASQYMNQLICLLYYSGYHIRGVNELNSQVIHSSAVIIDGYGFLFTGLSGIGKTTAARLCRDYGDAIVINDEANLISRPNIKDESFLIRGIPIIGKLAEKRNLTAPLFCILFLKQSARTALRRMDRVESIKRMLYLIGGYQYLGQNEVKRIISTKMKFGDEVTQHIPCFELEFMLDGERLSDTLRKLKDVLLKEREIHVR